MSAATSHIATAICSAALLIAQPAAAASRTAEELAGQCQLTSNLAVIVCHIYVHAVLDVMESDSVKGYRACVPEGTDIDEVVGSFVSWSGEHPDEARGPASDLIAHAVSEAYPCG